VKIFAVYSGWYGNNFAYPSQLITSIGHPSAQSHVSELHIPGATHLLHFSAHRQSAIAGIVDWSEASFPLTA
jgi:hypothetical protein